MRKLSWLSIVSSLLGLASLPVQPALADWCSFSATRTAQIDAGPLRKVVIKAGAGDLRVAGKASLTTAEASGKACASSQKLLDQIQIETRREGDTLYIRTVMPELTDGFWSVMRQVSLDLEVALPESVAVELEDSSGDLQLSGVRTATVADSSGDIDIHDIHGDLSVTDSSGDMHIATVSGNVTAQDSSGDIEVRDVTGNLEIPTDSSGEMRLRRVAGNVHIGNDSSGDIVIGQVQRDVTIDSDSSGDISVEEVAGNFTVHSDGSGDIHHSGVLGKVDVPDGHD